MKSPVQRPSLSRSAWLIFDLSLSQMLWSRRSIFLGLVVGGPVLLAFGIRALAAPSRLGLPSLNGSPLMGPALFGMMIWLVYIRFILPVLGWSIWQVRRTRQYARHRRLQVSLATILLVAVGAFELDVRVNGWRHLAVESPYFGSEGDWGLVYPSLIVHLFFAVSTVMLWTFVIVTALLRFPNPPLPGKHSPSHVFWGRLAAWDMVLTAVTGWVFYWLAFVS